MFPVESPVVSSVVVFGGRMKYDQILSFWSMFFSTMHLVAFRCGGLEQGCE